MAFYIDIVKTSEDDVRAIYRFEDCGRMGILCILKATGQISLEEPTVGSASDVRALFDRAARKINLHWKVGVLPDRTFWAS